MNRGQPVREKRLVLHIGATKTGTSALQVALVRNRSALLRKGVDYPESESDDEAQKGLITSGNGLRLASFLNPKLTFAARFDQQNTLDSTFGRIRTSGAHTTLFSSEHMSFFIEEHLAELADRARQEGVALEIVYLVRSIAEHALSDYNQRIKRHRLSANFDEYVRSGYLANFRHVIERAARHIPRERIHLLSYSKLKGNLTGEIFGRLGFPISSLDDMPGRVNRSLTAGEVALMRLVNPLLQSDSQGTRLSDALIYLTPEKKAAQVIGTPTFRYLKDAFQAEVDYVNAFAGEEIVSIIGEVAVLGSEATPDIGEAVSEIEEVILRYVHEEAEGVTSQYKPFQECLLYATRYLLLRDTEEAVLNSRFGSSDAEFIAKLYEALLKRVPGHSETTHWAGRLDTGMTDRELLSCILNSKEYARRNQVRLAYAPGHYYSPIVDPLSLDRDALRQRDICPKRLAGIHIDDERMLSFWCRNIGRLAGPGSPATKGAEPRYFPENNIYPLGDAVLLRLMMLEKRPRQLIEIGSGLSSACALDAADEGEVKTEFIFIEPYPDRLRSILRPEDHDRAEIIQQDVQKVPLDVFQELNEDDILLIDSTHVLKTGSDVHYELFKILPSLKPGVVIHFHDIQYPFEYPEAWIFESNFSWNEIYAVRAFLMHNADYEIEFFTSYFRHRFAQIIQGTFPRFLQSGGASLWIKKVGPSQPV